MGHGLGHTTCFSGSYLFLLQDYIKVCILSIIPLKAHSGGTNGVTLTGHVLDAWSLFLQHTLVIIDMLVGYVMAQSCSMRCVRVYMFALLIGSPRALLFGVLPSPDAVLCRASTSRRFASHSRKAHLCTTNITDRTPRHGNLILLPRDSI